MGCFKNKHLYGYEREEASDENMNDSADNLYIDHILEYYLSVEALDTSVSTLYQCGCARVQTGGKKQMDLCAAAVAVWVCFGFISGSH